MSVYTCTCTHDLTDHEPELTGPMPCTICRCPGWSAVAGSIAKPPPAEAITREPEPEWRFTDEMHDALFAELTRTDRTRTAAITWSDVIEAAVRLNFVTPVRGAIGAPALREAS